MTDLRKAAEMALEALETSSSFVDGYYIPKGEYYLPEVKDAIQVIRQALSQPEWVGVTYDEVYEFVCTTDSYIDFAKAIEAKLKEKNT